MGSLGSQHPHLCLGAFPLLSLQKPQLFQEGCETQVFREAPPKRAFSQVPLFLAWPSIQTVVEKHMLSSG